MAKVSSLWIGEPLSIAHRIALSSFVYHGHSVKLYVYDTQLDVPKGVTKVDARTIIPESEIFYHYGKLAPFADYFRYKMIAQTGEMWVDADTICLSNYFFEDKDYVFIEEKPGFYAQGILKMPQDSKLCTSINMKAKALIADKNESGVFSASSWTDSDAKSWIFLGPGLLTEVVNDLDLGHHAQTALRVNGIDLSVNTEDPYDLLWNPENLKLIAERLKESVSFTFFNSSLELRGLSSAKNSLVDGSYMWWLSKIFKYIL